MAFNQILPRSSDRRGGLARTLAVIALAAFLFAPWFAPRPGAAAGPPDADGQLVVYTSIRGELMDAIKHAFERQNPGIRLTILSSGAKRLMSKLAVERELGQSRTDVLWTSEAADFVMLKKNGFLSRYVSSEAGAIAQDARDPDGAYHVARFTIIIIAVNTGSGLPAPSTWKDLLKPEYCSGLALANPLISGTALMSVSLLAKAFGWDYFSALKKGGATLGEGTMEVINDVIRGKHAVCLAPAYLIQERIRAGAPLAFVSPEEVFVLPSPVAILKEAKNPDGAKRFVDFLLSRQGQEIIAASGSMPVRKDVVLPPGALFPSLEVMIGRSFKADYGQIAAGRDATLKRIREIFSAR